MEEIPLTRVYFESLSNAELVKIADDLGADISNESNRDSIITELIETVSQDDNEAVVFPEPESRDPVTAEAVPLPRRYNIAFIDVLIRDPFWAFVFWEIKASDEEQFEKEPDFNGYYLKLSPAENPGNLPPGESDAVFTVPVKSTDTAWYLGLAPAADEGNSPPNEELYKVELCVGRGDTETVLASSKPVRLPGQPVLSFGEENRLARLSGYKDFLIARKNERPSRTKRRVAAGSHE